MDIINNNKINNFHTIDVEKLNKHDLAKEIFLARGDILDSKVRDISKQVEDSNQLMEKTQQIINKSNIAQYGFPKYEQTTWKVNTVDNNTEITLDHGYKISITNTEDGNQLNLVDPKGNNLLYANGALIPMEKGAIEHDLLSGIPVKQSITLVLDNGTKINLQPNLGTEKLYSVVITRGNQGMSIDDFDTSNLKINLPTVEGVDKASTEEKIILPGHMMTHYKPYSETNDYGVFKEVADEMIASAIKELRSMGDDNRQSLWESIKKDGVVMRAHALDRQNQIDNYTSDYENIKPASTTNNIEHFFTNAITKFLANDFKEYVRDEEGYANFVGVGLQIRLPNYVYTEKIPPNIRETKTFQMPPISLKNYYGSSSSYSKIHESFNASLLAEILKSVNQLTTEQQEGLKKTLLTTEEYFSTNMRLYDVDDENEIYDSGSDTYGTMFYEHTMNPGETLREFFQRACDVATARFSSYIARLEGDINIEYISSYITFPEFSYNVYNKESENGLLYHSLDKKNNDGYVLLESGGINQWEYNGKNTSDLTIQDPDDETKIFTGLIAREKIFATTTMFNEIDAGMPLITKVETDMLLSKLGIVIQDASNKGELNEEEWKNLKKQLDTAQQTLTSTSQLQVVELKKAMQMFTANYETLSNISNRLFSLFKDISKI